MYQRFLIADHQRLNRVQWLIETRFGIVCDSMSVQKKPSILHKIWVRNVRWDYILEMVTYLKRFIYTYHSFVVWQTKLTCLFIKNNQYKREVTLDFSYESKYLYSNGWKKKGLHLTNPHSLCFSSVKCRQSDIQPSQGN